MKRIPLWLRDVALAAGVAAGAVAVMTRVLPAPVWNTGLGPRLLQTWGLIALYVLGCTSFGAMVVRRCSAGVRRDGFWGLAFATGVGCFATTLGALACVQLLNTVSFFVLPLSMFAIGLRDFAPEVMVSVQRHRTPALRLGPLQLAALLFGVVCLFLLLLQVIDPPNVNFDSRWYHLRIAERFALYGGFMRTPEGDQLLTLPQMASWLYTWAFMAPVQAFDDKLILALHLELSCVIGTLMLIPPMARVLMPTLAPAVTRLSWVALFFFPSIFIYDTGLMGGADHIVAMWGVGIPLALWQARQRRGPEGWWLVGVLSIGLLSKYTAVYLLVPMVPLVLIDWGVRWRQAGAAFTLHQKRGPFVAAAIGVVLTAPYWLRNWVWYGNPVYPSLARIFPNRPWCEDADAWQVYYKVATTWSPTGNFQHRVWLTLQALVNYTTELNTWGDMVGGQPVFGFTFLLATIALPFVFPRWRLVVVTLMLNGAIAVWFNTHQHHMRYLTVAMPLMATVAAATAMHLWARRTFVARGAVLLVVGFHLAAYADVPFRRTHGMNGRRSPIESSVEYIAMHGMRSSPVSVWQDVANGLPPRAVPVIHGVRAPLGINRQSVTDFVTLQFGLDYGRLETASGAWRKLRSLGATHLVWGPASTQFDSIGGEALFYGVASRTVERRATGGLYVGELPQTPPDDVGEGLLYLGCALYEPGLYKVAQLGGPIAAPEWPWPRVEPVQRVTTADWTAQLPRATYVVVENDCGYGAPPPDFERAGDQLELPKKVLTYYVRRIGRSTGW